MSVRLILKGRAKNVRHDGDVVSFTLTAKSSVDPPGGLERFGFVTYRVQCARRQWDKPFISGKADLVVEGYCEPRLGDDGCYITVVACSLLSVEKIAADKAKALAGTFERTKKDFQEAKGSGAGQVELERLAGAVMKAHERLEKAQASHP